MLEQDLKAYTDPEIWFAGFDVLFQGSEKAARVEAFDGGLEGSYAGED